MSARYKEHGGGSATGLADNLIQFLSQGLNTGTFGAGSPMGGDAMGQTQGIAGVLNDLLAGGGGNVGGALATQINTANENQVNQLRARYGAGGGTSFGTGAQYAEGTMRASMAPQLATAMGGLQMNALQMLLPLFANLAGRGIAQRSGTMSPHPLASAASIAAPAIGSAFRYFTPVGQIAGAAGDAIGQASQFPIAPIGGGPLPFMPMPTPMVPSLVN